MFVYDAVLISLLVYWKLYFIQRVGGCSLLICVRVTISTICLSWFSVDSVQGAQLL